MPDPHGHFDESGLSAVTQKRLGLLARARSLARLGVDHFAGLLQLALLEFEAERNRIGRVALGAAVGATAFGIGSMFAGFTVIALAWDTPYRVHSALAVTSVFILIGVASLVAVQRRLHRGGRPFAQTRDEIRRDIDVMEGLL